MMAGAVGGVWIPQRVDRPLHSMGDAAAGTLPFDPDGKSMRLPSDIGSCRRAAFHSHRLLWAGASQARRRMWRRPCRRVTVV